MATIMRVAWLPIVLSLVTNMAMVFALLSVANGRVITFVDVASFGQAAALANQVFLAGVMTANPQVLIILGGALVINGILISSFMAPLIRLAGLGEQPRPGILHAPFGMDQIRYLASGIVTFLTVLIVAITPIAVTTYFVAKYIGEALAKTYAHFPDEGSLHTIELATGMQVAMGRGEAWIYSLGVPALAALPFFLAMVILLMNHFKPSNRSQPREGANHFARGAVVIVSLAVLLGFVPFLFMLSQGIPSQLEGQLFLGIYLLAIILVSYVNIRMMPYQAVVVSRGSFAPGGFLQVTRGWNLLRLAFALFFLGLIVAVVEFLIAQIALPFTLSTFGTLLVTLGSYTKLTSGGEDPAWIFPVWVWFSAIFNIVVTIFWAFFTYGVSAGLYGRLFRESERVPECKI